MKYQNNRECIGQVQILGESFTVVINCNFDCDNDPEIYHAVLDTELSGKIDIIGSWLETVNMIEQLEDIIWRIEK